MIWLAAMWGKLRTAALVLAALAAAVLSAWLFGRRAGKQAQSQAHAASDAQAAVQAAQDTIKTQEVRRDVEAEVSKLPDAPAQRLSDAKPGTAAGLLRDGGWLRDKNSGQG